MHTSTADPNEPITVASVLAGRHRVLARVDNLNSGMWLVEPVPGQIAVCGARFDASGRLQRISVAFRAGVSRLPDLIGAFERASFPDTP